MTALTDADLWGAPPSGVPAVAGQDATVAPVNVTAPSLKNAPVVTAGGRDALTDQQLFPDGGGTAYQQTQPDQALGFQEHLVNAVSRLNKINPLAYLDPSLGRLQSSAQAWAQAQEAQGKRPGFWGSLAGDIVGSVPAMALPGGPLVQGAASGALTGRSTTPLGLATDVGVGALGGKVADTVANGAVNAVAPRISAAAQYLMDRNIPLTAGMLAGNKGFWGRLEQVGQAIPGAGELIRKRGNETLEALNAAGANDALAPIGANITPGATGNETYTNTAAAMNHAYDSVGKGLSAIPLDNQLGQEMTQHRTRVGALPSEFQKAYNDLIANELGLRIDPQSGGFTPEGIKDAKAAINAEIDAWKGQPGWGSKYVGILKDTRRSLTDLLGRSSPEAQAQLAAADAAYPGFKTYQRAVRNSTNNSLNPNGYFTPQHLQSAVNYGATDATRAAASGSLQPLAEAAKAVLPTQFKKVVSPWNMAIEGLVGAGVTGSDVLGSHLGGAPAGLALASPMLLGPLYSKSAQDFVRGALTKSAKGRVALEGLLGPLENYVSRSSAPLGGLLSAQGIDSLLPYASANAQ